ncbi:hypothetical protein PoB_002888200 [Plakobranchus ocellatus]|uniref:Uncharacterized protein n=1 Tax=Plakobranchus ocellatus TaxID=259542 RepID=A0AAV4A541_9GAST|nr:hypothetical protein PoB_002888200 [Plakobranchus ocellatus]
MFMLYRLTEEDYYFHPKSSSYYLFECDCSFCPYPSLATPAPASALCSQLFTSAQSGPSRLASASPARSCLPFSDHPCPSLTILDHACPNQTSLPVAAYTCPTLESLHLPSLSRL